MKLYSTPIGICKKEFAIAIIVGLANSGLLIGTSPREKHLLREIPDSHEGPDCEIPSEILAGMISGTIRCDRSWSSPPDDYLASLAYYADGKEPPDADH